VAEPIGHAEVRRALAEDKAGEDVTTTLLGAAADRSAEGRFVAEEAFVVAGLPVAALVFQELDPQASLDPLIQEGTQVKRGDVLATVRATARALLGGERVALNFLQRLSGIATVTRRAVDAAGATIRITHTRKTTPGLRELERYAVRKGGGVDNRGSLAEAVFWKDNHWSLLRRDGGTLKDALAKRPAGVPLIVEVETEEQLTEALAAGANHLVIDNQPPATIAEWAKRAGPGVTIQASGGITPDNVADYARAGVHMISMGGLTHSAKAAPISFEITA
jgi:nicotinate-nucleotide pyrophosphorylase (carboxylating)